MMNLIALRIVPFAALGGLLGFVYFSALALNIGLYLGRGTGWIALMVHLVRLLAIGVAFTLCARQGALALLSSLGGFQVMRTFAVNQQSRALERKS